MTLISPLCSLIFWRYWEGWEKRDLLISINNSALTKPQILLLNQYRTPQLKELHQTGVSSAYWQPQRLCWWRAKRSLITLQRSHHFVTAWGCIPPTVSFPSSFQSTDRQGKAKTWIPRPGPWYTESWLSSESACEMNWTTVKKGNWSEDMSISPRNFFVERKGGLCEWCPGRLVM